MRFSKSTHYPALTLRGFLDEYCSERIPVFGSQTTLRAGKKGACITLKLRTPPSQPDGPPTLTDFFQHRSPLLLLDEQSFSAAPRFRLCGKTLWPRISYALIPPNPSLWCFTYFGRITPLRPEKHSDHVPQISKGKKTGSGFSFLAAQKPTFRPPETVDRMYDRGKVGRRPGPPKTYDVMDVFIGGMV